MLPCKQVCCGWHLVYVVCSPANNRSDPLYNYKGTNMSKTASFGLAPSPSLFDRLTAAINRVLMASAAISNRNGDLPYFGL